MIEARLIVAVWLLSIVLGGMALWSMIA